MSNTIYQFSVTFVLLTLFVLASRYFRETWIFATAQSLQLHLGILCILAALLCMLISRNVFVVALLIASIAITGHAVYMAQRYTISLPASALADLPVYRLISFNTLNTNGENGGRIADMLASSGADIVITIESNPLEGQREKLAKTYPYRLSCENFGEACSIVMLSKRPFLATEKRSLGSAEDVLMATVLLDDTPVRFVAVHLSKPYFDTLHQMELHNLTDMLAQIPEPVVLGGDFNAATVAPDMQRFLQRSELRAAFPEPATWPVRAGPFGVGIDHIYAREPAVLRSVRRIADPFGSNHFGLIAEFSITR